MPTPEFTWSPYVVTKATDSIDLITTEYESGKVQRRKKADKPRKWEFVFKVNKTDYQAIRAFIIDDAEWGVNDVLITDPLYDVTVEPYATNTSGRYVEKPTVRIVETDIEYTDTANKYFEFTITFEEVL